MHRIELDDQTREHLVKLFKTTKDNRFKTRIQAVLMAARQQKRKQIAKDLEVSGVSIRRWLRLWREEGLESLKDKPKSGRPPLISDDYAPQIIDWVKQSPTACGLDRANWTFAELANHFYKVHGIKVSETAMREFCHKHGVYPYRPTYRFLKADPEKQAKAKEELKELKKRLSKENSSC